MGRAARRAWTRASPTTRARTPRIGINGTVVNSVNAKAESLSAAYLEKTAALADTFRPYGIRLYLAANFAAPKLLGGLPDRGPARSRRSRTGGRTRRTRSTALIPDFGGFVVKANSEGQPGPQDYRRTHADGANVLADAVAPARRHRDVAGLRLRRATWTPTA